MPPADAGTEGLQARYKQPNVVVRDYVDFAHVFEFTDVFITNGGFGGVQLSLSKGVPLVVSGINEGKSDVNARVEYAGVGINLKTGCTQRLQTLPGPLRNVLGDPPAGNRAHVRCASSSTRQIRPRPLPPSWRVSRSRPLGDAGLWA